MGFQLKVRGTCAAAVVLAMGIPACSHAGSRAPAQAAPPAGPPPAWVTHVEVDGDTICGIGVAGAGYDESSPYPKQLSRERAVRNLAGVLETNVLEAMVDRTTDTSQDIEVARGLELNEAIVAEIDGLAEVEFWLDKNAVGPFAQRNFTYAKACVDGAKVAAKLKVNPNRIANKPREPNVPGKLPRWINRGGKQKGGRLCAVGFSLPMFFADNTFEAVTEDVRAQLADVIETLVSQYSEDITTERAQTVEMMTLATTQAISKGAVVTEFWYDRDGIGPNHKQRSTYGWGCVFPVTVLQQGIAAVEKSAPQQAEIDKVKERAAKAFSDLDDEIAKREKRQGDASAAAPDGRTEP